MSKRRASYQDSSINESFNTFGSESESNNQKQRPASIQIPSGNTQSIGTPSSYHVVTRRRNEDKYPVTSPNTTMKKEVRTPVALDAKPPEKTIKSEKSLDSVPKRQTTQEKIHEAVEEDMNDPELTRLLQKIAYCRVFTDYLFRQYDMLTIDFQLNSNLEDLMMELKRRVGAYNAIRRSRKQFLVGLESNSNSGDKGA